MPYKWKNNKKEYHKEYHAKWYQKNKDKVKSQKSARIKKAREWFFEYKSKLSYGIVVGSSPTGPNTVLLVEP